MSSMTTYHQAGGGSNAPSKAPKVNFSIDFYWIGMQNYKKKLQHTMEHVIIEFYGHWPMISKR